MQGHLPRGADRGEGEFLLPTPSDWVMTRSPWHVPFFRGKGRCRDLPLFRRSLEGKQLAWESVTLILTTNSRISEYTGNLYLIEYLLVFVQMARNCKYRCRGTRQTL